MKLILLIFLGLSSYRVHSTNVSIGIGKTIAPFYISPTSGIEKEVIDLVLNKLKWKATYHPFSLNRARISISTAKMDIALTSIKENKSLFYSDEYIYYSNVGVSLKSKNYTINNFKQLKKMSVSAWQGAYKVLGKEYSKYLNPNNPKYYESENIVNTLKIFWLKRIDILFIDRYIFEWDRFKNNSHFNDNVTFHELFQPFTYYHVAFKDKKMRDDFNKALREIKKKKLISKIYKKYLPQIDEASLPF